MDKIRPYIVIFIILTFIGFIAWSIFSPKNDLQEIIDRKLAGEKERSDVMFKVVTFSEIDNGIKYWELNAASSTINKSTGIANLKSVDGIFFKNGEPALKFIAPKAIWNLEKKEISLVDPLGYDIKSEKEVLSKIKKLGGIKRFISFFSLPSEKLLSKSKGYWFKAKKLEWKLSTKKLYCEGGIILTKGDMTLRSKKLEADVGLEKVIMTGNPHAVLISEKDQSKININATSFLVDSRIDKIFANDNVKIKSSSSSIFSKYAVYDQVKKSISLLDEVSINTKNIFAWGDKALYSTIDYIAELTGNARARRGKSELAGEKIIILTEEGKLFVIGRSKAKIQESDIKE